MRVIGVVSRAICVLGLIVHPAVFCATSEDKRAVIARVIESRFPQVKVEQVNPVPQLPGLYEVVTSNEIVYTAAKADVLIAGKTTK